eukprot:scaffold113741_cov33-Phaeocystis_antarctica.AAC.1
MTPLTTPPYYTPLLHPLTASLPPLTAPSQSLLGVDKGAKGMSKDELGRLLANTNSGADGYELTEQARADAKEAVTSQLSTGTHSRAFYRVSATRSATGGKDMVGQEAKIKAQVRAASPP